MKKLALLFLGLGSLAAFSVSAATYPSEQAEPQYQEQCAPAQCYTPTADNQVPCNVPVNQQPCDPAPCNPAPCQPDTVCNPAPCNPAPCQPGC